ncbi:MAG: hypothetical protein OXC12_03410 [Spirochaetaceae bacterium]|nr:hypothetical protein [Spirochaetaceae bacterium]
MQLCTDVGAAGDLLRDGSLNLSNAAQLQNLFERSDRNERKRAGPPGSDGDKDGSGEAARDARPSGKSASSAPAGAGERGTAARPVLDAAAREKLVRQAAGKSTREVQQMLAEVDPELAQPNDRMRALGTGRWELKAAIDAECRHGLEKLQMLLSHADPHLTLGGLVARLVRDGLDRYDPERPRRTRRTGGRGSVNAARKPVRRDTDAAQRSAAGALGGNVERRSEVEREDESSVAVRNGAAPPSAANRHTEAEHGGAKSAPLRETVRRTNSAANRHTEAERGSANPAAVREIVRRTNSAAQRNSEVERGNAESAPAREIVRRSASAPKRASEAGRGNAESAPVREIVRRTNSTAQRNSEVERGNAESAAARGIVRRSASAPKRASVAGRGNAESAPARGIVRHSDSAPKRAGPDADAHVEDAKHAGGTATWAAGRRRETQHACAATTGRRGSGGRAASPPKRQGRAAGDGRDEGKCGVPGRATSAARPPMGDRHRVAGSAANRLGHRAGYGAAGPAERSPALERHLTALSCFGALPESRSRYIPVAVKREVWRRDQGCCSYVDRHSGRRCGSRFRLEIDHIVPFALGGGAEPGNLRL